MSLTDITLAVRMLFRYPGLTLVAVLGISVGVSIAAAAFTIVSLLMNPALPFDEGDRIVAIGNWHVQTNNRDMRVLHELPTWRSELRSVEDVGAFRQVSRNLTGEGVASEVVGIAEISAAAFRVTRVNPALGRTLLPEDERAGAPDVVVIGDDEWRRRFGGDPAVIGRAIQLGTVRHTIVGVMPPGFAFPVNHGYWTPLRVAASYEPLTGQPVTVFARLAPGVSLEAAQSEAGAVGQRVSAASPRTHEFLRTRVIPYTHAFTGLDDPAGALVLRFTQFSVLLLLTAVCVNVAILVYARTAMRQGEIAVRSALGASRRRIVGQLFTEALALSGVAALAAIALLSFGFDQLRQAFQQLPANRLPFWVTFELSPGVVLSIVAFAVLSAAIVGVLPALKATGRRVQARLQTLSAGSGARMQMGRMWTLLIVAQVGVATAALPMAAYFSWNMLQFRAEPIGFAANEFLTGGLSMERATDIVPSSEAERQFRSTYGQRLAELERRLEAETAISDVTFSLTPPGEELAAIVEVDGATVPSSDINYNIVEGGRQGHLIRFNRVGLDFFEAFEVPLLMGRALQPDDLGAAGGGVLIDRTFMDRLFSGQNPLGRRIRYVGRSREAGEGNVVLGPWYEIVGVVSDFSSQAGVGELPDPRVYHAAAAGDVYPVMIGARVRGSAPGGQAARVREITTRLDPSLQIEGLSTAEEVLQRDQRFSRLIGVTIAAAIGSVVALSAAGIYALMSFTVSRRRKEIGIRTALGANYSRILVGIFSRAIWQLGAGGLAGIAMTLAAEALVGGEMMQGNVGVVVTIVAVFMIAVGLLASLGPARRALRMQPTEALRED